MFTKRLYPQKMPAKTLDTYLERGWYRMGQGIFTCHFLYFEHSFYSAIWIRQDLRNYRFKKRLRKLMNRNKQRFTYTIEKARLPDATTEELYQKYKLSFDGLLATNLKESLQDGYNFNIYNTFKISIFDEGKLVAASYFDIGHKSAASILGIYDPDYNNHSLGFYTMLLEIEYCLTNDIDYYYPGYVVPGYKRFDYKLRIGDVEFLHLTTNIWLPYEALSQDDTPLEIIKDKLEGMQQFLNSEIISNKLFYYPLFEINVTNFWQTSNLPYPIVLICFPDEYRVSFPIVVYDIIKQEYLYFQCSSFNDFANSEMQKELGFPANHYMEILLKEDLIFKSRHPEMIISAIKRHETLDGFSRF